MKTFVIIPAFNEGARIGKVVRESQKYSRNIVVVDDGSTDGTFREAAKTKATVLKHTNNLGKGSALRTGSEYALRQGADTVIYIDSDGQHSPKDIPRLLKELRNADIVFAYRNLARANMPLTKKFGNFVLDGTLTIFFGVKITDSQCGFKAMTNKTYEKLKLTSNGYTVESEIAAKTGKHHLRFRQVPIETVYNDRYKGTNVFDGINIALHILRWKFTG